MMNIINNFLNPDTVAMLTTILAYHMGDLGIDPRDKNGHSIKLETNQTKWLLGLVRKSAPIDLIDLDGAVAKMIKTDIGEKLLAAFPDLDEILEHKWEIGLHIGRENSYIAWHSDDQNALAITVYLNQTWDPNWGGWFLFKLEDDQLVQAILPQHNLGLVYDPPLMHSVALANPDAPPRLSLQIFVTKADAD